MYDIPKKRLLELRLVRAERLIKDQEEIENAQKEKQQKAVREQIMNPY